MTRKRILLVVVLLVAFGAVYYFYGGHSVPKGQPPLLSFSAGDLTPLKTAFTASARFIRGYPRASFLEPPLGNAGKELNIL